MSEISQKINSAKLSVHLKILLFTTESVDALLVGVALSVLPALTELSENTSRSDVVVVFRGNDVFVGWLSWPRSTTHSS